MDAHIPNRDGEVKSDGDATQITNQRNMDWPWQKSTALLSYKHELTMQMKRKVVNNLAVRKQMKERNAEKQYHSKYISLYLREWVDMSTGQMVFNLS